MDIQKPEPKRQPAVGKKEVYTASLADERRGGDKGENIRKSLYKMLTHAEIDLEMWKAMRKARSEQEVISMLNRRYGRFYSAAENALFNSLIIILYKMYETRDDTVNFEQLFKLLPADILPEIKAEIDERKAKIKTTWIKVSSVRNKIVGHQSLEQRAEEVHRIAGITIVELHRLIKNAQDLLCLIAKYFHDTHIVFNLKGTQSFDNLIDDLRVHNSLKPIPFHGVA